MNVKQSCTRMGTIYVAVGTAGDSPFIEIWSSKLGKSNKKRSVMTTSQLLTAGEMKTGPFHWVCAV
jgi:hypothetical protein